MQVPDPDYAEAVGLSRCGNFDTILDHPSRVHAYRRDCVLYVCRVLRVCVLCVLCALCAPAPRLPPRTRRETHSKKHATPRAPYAVRHAHEAPRTYWLGIGPSAPALSPHLAHALSPPLSLSHSLRSLRISLFLALSLSLSHSLSLSESRALALSLALALALALSLRISRSRSLTRSRSPNLALSRSRSRSLSLALALRISLSLSESRSLSLSRSLAVGARPVHI